jgi:iron complex outermembrane receptor protein
MHGAIGQFAHMPFHRIRWLIAGLMAAGLVSPLLSAEEPLLLPPLLIEVTRDQAPWLDTPAAVTQIGAAGREGEQGQALDEWLHAAPGVFTLNRYNAAQGLRPSLRGFGARAGFGVRGIRVRVDDIPLTLPDGQTELDALDLGLLERAEVLRGPASALYGNAAGGVVSLYTREVPEAARFALEAGAGEPGARNLRFEAGTGRDGFGALGALSLRELEGFRRHAAAETAIASGKLHWVQAAGGLTLGLNALDVDAQDSGGLTAAERRADRRAAAPSNLRFDAGEDIRQQRISLGWVSSAGQAVNYRLSAWGGQRDFANRLPFTAGGQSSFSRDFGGLGAQLGWHARGFGIPQYWVAGLDLEAQRDNRRRHDNLDGARGAETLRQRESVRSAGLYMEDRLDLGERWLAALGLRHDRLRFVLEDAFLADGDDSGRRSLDETSYHLGLGFRPDDVSLIYLRAGSAFESPTLAEFANPAGGGFNPELEPAQARSVELGFKHEQGTLRYELALYRIHVRDELLRFELPAQPGRSFFRNAGRSRRDGFELGLDWRFAPRWQLGAAYSRSDYCFVDYRLGAQDFSGNEIPGLPRQQLFAELAYGLENWQLRLSLQAVDRMFADDANATRVAGYTLASLRLNFDVPGAPRWQPYIGLNDIFDRDYDDNIRINAGGQRYFEPAPGRTAYAGVEARW